MMSVNKIKWMLRRLNVPVGRDALVLEVGSGGNPYPRSNVLVDAYEDTRERHWAPLVHDRPTVLANGERLPFKDKAFDYVIAAHVLEHTSDPALFLEELQRVARAGYIETPDAFMERINPYKDHRLEVTVRDNALRIRKKHQWIVDDELVELYEARAKTRVTQNLIPEYPEDFHMRYYWQHRIDYELVNPDVDAAWQEDIPSKPSQKLSPVAGLKSALREAWLRGLRFFFSQRARNSSIDLLPLLRCPECKGEEFVPAEGKGATCSACQFVYHFRDGVLIMNSAR